MNYAVGENALCYHGILIYEAKILQAQDWTKDAKRAEDGPHYFVHYKGWKNTWDEWVTDDRLMKLNPENVTKQKRLAEAIRKQAAEKAAAQKAATAGKNNAGKGDSGGATAARNARSRKRGAEEEPAAARSSEKKVLRVDLSEHLKYLLVDQWEAITGNYALVPIPREPNVKTVLNEYQKAAVKRAPENENIIAEFVAGTKMYFDRSLGSNLLYKFERGQYADLLRELKAKTGKDPEDFEMSEYYGAEHLLRLFVNMPKMVQQVSMKQATQEILERFLNDLVAFVDENRDAFFAKDYQPTNMGYQADNKP